MKEKSTILAKLEDYKALLIIKEDRVNNMSQMDFIQNNGDILTTEISRLRGRIDMLEWVMS